MRKGSLKLTVSFMGIMPISVVLFCCFLFFLSPLLSALLCDRRSTVQTTSQHVLGQCILMQTCTCGVQTGNNECVACRLLLCNKLLLHTTLPLPSLILLLHLLDALPPQQRESGAVTQTRSTLIGVTSTLAEVFSSQPTLTE